MQGEESIRKRIAELQEIGISSDNLSSRRLTEGLRNAYCYVIEINPNDYPLKWERETNGL